MRLEAGAGRPGGGTAGGAEVAAGTSAGGASRSTTARTTRPVRRDPVGPRAPRAPPECRHAGRRPPAGSRSCGSGYQVSSVAPSSRSSPAVPQAERPPAPLAVHRGARAGHAATLWAAADGPRRRVPPRRLACSTHEAEPARPRPLGVTWPSSTLRHLRRQSSAGGEGSARRRGRGARCAGLGPPRGDARRRRGGGGDRPRPPERVVLAGHLDTVPVAATCPPGIEGDLLVGRGTADMKGGVAVQLKVAAALPRPRATSPSSSTLRRGGTPTATGCAGSPARPRAARG